jgi:nitrogen fixation NifU-like protein
MTEFQDLYQELILDHNKRPRNRRPLADASHEAEGYNPLCGDRVTIHARVKEGVIQEATFEGSGCAISTASASLMTEAMTGKTVQEADALFERFHDLITHHGEVSKNGPALGKLAAFSGVGQYPARVKCATLAWHTLKSALEGEYKIVSTETAAD